ncbi:MAG: hypothetical protein GIX02_09465, partial [Candidatus Eremiobacteraeota bacterium]|nr:hypothetical protein [Candidatus Eremiobacteraeota bacterium]
ARVAFTKATQLDPDNMEAVFCLGQIDVVEGKDKDALARFLTVISRSGGKHVAALFEAACLYQTKSQYDQAVLAFKRVLNLDPTHVQAAVHMGGCHRSRGMLPEALGYYVQAAKMAMEARQNGTARQLLYMVLALNGTHQAARYLLEEVEEHSEAPSAAAPLPSDAAPARVADLEDSMGTAQLEGSIIKAQTELAALLAKRDAVQREIDTQLAQLPTIQAAQVIAQSPRVSPLHVSERRLEPQTNSAQGAARFAVAF